MRLVEAESEIVGVLFENEGVLLGVEILVVLLVMVVS